MDTRVIKLDPELFTDQELLPAVQLIQRGELVSFPTETVYGMRRNVFFFLIFEEKLLVTRQSVLIRHFRSARSGGQRIEQ